MFSKLLIANRGEIACRIVATARRLGIATVAVHSDADAAALHVQMADEAVRIGPAPAAESYLQGKRIIEAAQATGAGAIHPGYGFLSENPDFAEAVAAAGLIFIGPPAGAIRAMGLKDAAKALMEKAGVPVVPGYHGAAQGAGHLAAEAARIGYPLLIKARAGGGGKGMRLVERPQDFAAALASARREAEASFGDGACLIEKYIAQARHIEIQVFGDAHGNVIHLFERDCSLQRRHQKVIEEAPAPGMTEAVRAAMGAAAVQAARAIGYQGAGTVEFIADASGPLRLDGFWFMEMNTRLQVEHPVTEAVTGLDLVEWQLRVAAGEPLPLRQNQVRLHGHAIEARLYAEDATKDFQPATGRIGRLDFPPATAFDRGPLRVDAGVQAGGEIGPFYDPMIAKFIAHGSTRSEALARLGAALGACRITGLVTNLRFLSALCRSQAFKFGAVETGLIARELAALTEAPPPSPLMVALAALGGLGLLAPLTGPGPWRALNGWRAWGTARHVLSLEGPTGPVEAQVNLHGQGRFTVETGGESVALTVTAVEGSALRVALGERQLTAEVLAEPGRVTVWSEGQTAVFTLPERLAGSASTGPGGDALLAPMPGLVKAALAAPGAEVAAGEVLMVLETMKMEHGLAAPRAGRVAEVLAAPGDQVAEGAVLVRLEPEDG